MIAFRGIGTGHGEPRFRTGLLRDITEILSRERISVTATNTVSRGAAARR